jgi:hypothetical protein
MAWVERWFDTSTLALGARRVFRTNLAATGRWLAAEQPGIVTPADWTRETCAAWIVRVVRLRVGDYAQRRVGLGERVGQPLGPTTISSYISATRILLRDCQEWGWCPRRFDPIAALATPRSVCAMIVCRIVWGLTRFVARVGTVSLAMPAYCVTTRCIPNRVIGSFIRPRKTASFLSLSITRRAGNVAVVGHNGQIWILFPLP